MKQVLLIDGDEENLAPVQSELDGLCKVAAATSSREALSYLEKGDCDLVLLDTRLPDADGLEFMNTVHAMEAFAELPFIFLTAGASVESESNCLTAGAADYIAKPFSPAVLRARVYHALKSAERYCQLSCRLQEKILEVSDIRDNARKDALTGLWDRVYTQEKVNALCREGVRGALFMIDMDNFKFINDHYGHIAGDNVLRSFADTMRAFSTEDDILCRIGGDEFVMYFNRDVGIRNLGKFAEEIIADLSRKLEENGYDTNTSVSIGIALLPEDGADFNAAYNAADKALYYVKQNGKKSFRFYNERRKSKSRDATLVDLRYLKDAMVRSDRPDGSYVLDSGGFRHVYHFIQRFLERSDHPFQTVLFTAHSDTDPTDPKLIDQAIEALTQAIHNSLRRADVVTRYSSRQVIAILINVNEENREMVASRIIKNYEEIFGNHGISIDYEISSI